VPHDNVPCNKCVLLHWTTHYDVYKTTSVHDQELIHREQHTIMCHVTNVFRCIGLHTMMCTKQQVFTTKNLREWEAMPKMSFNRTSSFANSWLLIMVYSLNIPIHMSLVATTTCANPHRCPVLSSRSPGGNQSIKG
jgi:hypothetical protein